MVLAEARIHALQWEPVRGASALLRTGYLAGNDAARLADLQHALDDPEIDAVWFMRGGYGTTRILPHVSFDAFIKRPKAVIGYSDATALHCAIMAQTGVVTYHAPVARASLPKLSTQSLQSALTRIGEPCGEWALATPVRTGRATGKLVGGNLATLAAIAGTPNAMVGAGAIVILEDVHEPAYRVDRMLRQLEQSSAFDGCVGLAVGQFTEVPADESPHATTINELIVELADRLSVPCLANLPFGHIQDQWTLPLGATAVLDISTQSLRIAESNPIQLSA
jgi:muramoyltetrapeptide carboxypeptidase